MGTRFVKQAGGFECIAAAYRGMLGWHDGVASTGHAAISYVHPPLLGGLPHEATSSDNSLHAAAEPDSCSSGPNAALALCIVFFCIIVWRKLTSKDDCLGCLVQTGCYCISRQRKCSQSEAGPLLPISRAGQSHLVQLSFLLVQHVSYLLRRDAFRQPVLIEVLQLHVLL